MPKGISLEKLVVYSLALAEENRRLVGGVEVRLAGVGLGLDGLGPLHPVGGAHLPVLQVELDGLHQPEGLVHAAPDAEVIAGDVPDDVIGVQDKEPPVSNAPLPQHPVGLGDGHVLVGHQGDLDATNTPLLAGGLHPSKMREDRVSGNGHDVTVHSLELLVSVRKRGDLGGAHEGEVHGVEEDDQETSLYFVKADLDHLLVEDGLSGERRSFLTNAIHGDYIYRVWVKRLRISKTW